MWSEISRQNYQSVSGAEWLGDKQKWKRSSHCRTFFLSSEFLVFGRQFWRAVAGTHKLRDASNSCLQSRRIKQTLSSPLPSCLLHSFYNHLTRTAWDSWHSFWNYSINISKHALRLWIINTSLGNQSQNELWSLKKIILFFPVILAVLPGFFPFHWTTA